MKRIGFLMLALLAFPAWGASGTITGATSGAVEQTVRLRYGCGTLRLGNATSADFGSGTITLKELDESGAWAAVTTYTAAPDPNPATLNFMGRDNVDVGVSMASGSGHDLYWQITSGRCGGP